MNTIEISFSFLILLSFFSYTSIEFRKISLREKKIEEKLNNDLKNSEENYKKLSELLKITEKRLFEKNKELTERLKKTEEFIKYNIPYKKHRCSYCN